MKLEQMEDRLCLIFSPGSFSICSYTLSYLVHCFLQCSFPILRKWSLALVHLLILVLPNHLQHLNSLDSLIFARHSTLLSSHPSCPSCRIPLAGRLGFTAHLNLLLVAPCISIISFSYSSRLSSSSPWCSNSMTSIRRIDFYLSSHFVFDRLLPLRCSNHLRLAYALTRLQVEFDKEESICLV